VARLTRERILETARAQLARYGPRKMSLADVARALGVSKAALYHHFPGGKHEILEAVLDAEGDRILARMRAAVGEASDPRERFRGAVLARLQHLAWLREVLGVGKAVGEEIRALCEDQERRFAAGERALFEAILEDGQRRGIFREASRERLARGIQNALRDLEATLVFAEDGETEATVDELFDVLFYGIVRPGAGGREP